MAFYGQHYVRAEEIKVATAEIISSKCDATGGGPKSIKWYFLVFECEKDGTRTYREIFSGGKIKYHLDTSGKEFSCKEFDTPYIKKVEPLSEYMNNNATHIEAQVLFDFILNLNVHEQLGLSNGSKM